MPNRVNTLLLKEYTDRLGRVDSLLSIGYEGLDVGRTNELRSRIAEKNCGMLFVRNRAVARAFKEMGKADVASICQGQTAFVFGEDVVGLARFLVDFQKEHKELKLHGALVEGEILDDRGVVDLSKSPTKEELKGIVAGQATAPGRTLGGALLGVGAMLASQVKQLAEKEDGDGSEQAAPSA